jgi:hypothetical protein
MRNGAPVARSRAQRPDRRGDGGRAADPASRHGAGCSVVVIPATVAAAITPVAAVPSVAPIAAITPVAAVPSVAPIAAITPVAEVTQA